MDEKKLDLKNVFKQASEEVESWPLWMKQPEMRNMDLTRAHGLLSERKTMIRVIKQDIEPVTLLTENDCDNAVEMIETCGRISHKSKSRGNPASFINKWAIRAKHESILEHVVATYKITCDRTASHQIVRHRVGASYTQESQRYCDYEKGGSLDVIMPPSIGEVPDGTIVTDGDEARFHPQQQLWLIAVRNAYNAYIGLRDALIPPEDARGVLPGCTATRLYATYNLRMWRHVIKERALNKHAQWHVREIFGWILDDLVDRIPSVFGDLKEVKNG